MAFGKRKPVEVDGAPKPHVSDKIANRRLAALEEARDILQHIPGAGGSLHAIMTGRYDLTDTLEIIFAKLGTVEHLRCSTLSFNTHNIQVIGNWLESQTVKQFSLLFSLFFKQNSPELIQALNNMLEGKPGHRTAAARSHCKIIAMHFVSGRKLSLEGSANLRTCSSREQFVLIDDPALHDHHAAYIDEQVTKHGG